LDEANIMPVYKTAFITGKQAIKKPPLFSCFSEQKNSEKAVDKEGYFFIK